MANYQEARVKLTNTQLNKLKLLTLLRINKKNFEDKELPHESFLTIRQTTKIRNAFANSISTYTVLQIRVFRMADNFFV